MHNGNKCNVDLQDAINDDVANKGIHIKVDGQELRLRIRNTDAEDLDDWALDVEAALPAQAADKKLQKAFRNIKKQGFQTLKLKSLQKIVVGLYPTWSNK